MGERQLNIAFAEPKQSDLAATSQGQSKVAYVGGLPEGTNDSKLQDALLSYGEVRPGWFQESCPVLYSVDNQGPICCHAA